MDSLDILQQFRKLYFNGNYIKLIETWNETDDQTFGQNSLYIDFFVARSLISQRLLQPQYQLQIKKKPSQQLMKITEITNKFLSPILSAHKGTQSQEKQDFIELLQIFNELNIESEITQIIQLYLALRSDDHNFISNFQFQTQENLQKVQLEVLYLQVINYIRAFRNDLAEQKLVEMKKEDDEDILTLLGQMHFYIAEEKFKEALQIINEVKERYGESSSIVNIKISIYIQQRNFEQAHSLSLQLYQIMTTKEKIFDKTEMTTCLSNLIILGQILGKDEPEYLKLLNDLNPQSPYLKRTLEANQLFQQFAETLSQKQ